jgi:hypothetical protein
MSDCAEAIMIWGQVARVPLWQEERSASLSDGFRRRWRACGATAAYKRRSGPSLRASLLATTGEASASVQLLPDSKQDNPVIPAQGTPNPPSEVSIMQTLMGSRALQCKPVTYCRAASALQYNGIKLAWSTRASCNITR